MPPSPNKKTFSQFFRHSYNPPKIWNTFNQKMNLRGCLVLKLETAKRGVTEMSKRPCARTLMDSQHVKGSETLLKSERQYLGHIF